MGFGTGLPAVAVSPLLRGGFGGVGGLTALPDDGLGVVLNVVDGLEVESRADVGRGVAEAADCERAGGDGAGVVPGVAETFPLPIFDMEVELERLDQSNHFLLSARVPW